MSSVFPQHSHKLHCASSCTYDKVTTDVRQAKVRCVYSVAPRLMPWNTILLEEVVSFHRPLNVSTRVSSWFQAFLWNRVKCFYVINTLSNCGTTYAIVRNGSAVVSLLFFKSLLTIILEKYFLLVSLTTVSSTAASALPRFFFIPTCS